MKKLTFLIYYKEYALFLQKLQQLGVYHIQKTGNEEPTSAYAESISKTKDELASVDRVIAAFEQLTEYKPLFIGKAEKAEGVVAEFDRLSNEEKAKANRLNLVQQELEQLHPWGTFDRSGIEKLEENGIAVKFYKTTADFMRKHPEYEEGIVSQNGKDVYFVHFSAKDEEPESIQGIPVQLPNSNLIECQAEYDALQSELKSIEAEKKSLASKQLNHLCAYQVQLTNKLTMYQAQAQTTAAAEDKIMVLEGWFPTDKEEEVTSFLDASDKYYEIRDPEPTDNVPIKLKNNAFNKMFECLTMMYGCPSYNEWDPTPIVAPFFTLFFAICMGDAGYGLIIMLYGMLEMAGKARKTPIVGEMLQGCGGIVTVLGAATLIVGLALGTVFGVNIAEMSIPDGLKSYYAFVQGNFPGTSYSFQMASAIIIGVFHVCIAMIVKAITFTKKEGLKSQLSQWGWCLLIIGGIITAVCTMVGTLSQQVTTYLFIIIGIVSALCIYFLNNVDRLKTKPALGLIVNPLSGLYDTYNMASGLMGDVLSYMRLYALCLAGGALGSAFNMIGNMLWGSIGGCIGAIIIYAIGHILNLLLSSISAFVHPLRLNFVEYFKNAGFEGKGTEYHPFEEKN